MFVKDISESGLYYFGARYYDPTLYRFLSPDPVIPADRAVYNPQRWNLYGYCGGNPISNVEVFGYYYILGSIYIYRQVTIGNVTYGSMYFFNPESLWAKGLFVPYAETKEKAPNNIAAGTYIGQFRWIDAKIKNKNGQISTTRVLSLVLFDLKGDRVTWQENGEKYIGAIHTGTVEDSNGCIIVDRETMNYIWGVFNYYFSMFDKAMNAALFANQINQVVYGFAALEWYSEFFYFHFFWVYIVDPPQQTSGSGAI